MDLELNKIYQGDSLEVLKTFPDESVDCCITSPPYWGLRDYGTATWEGGDVECEHKGKPMAIRTNIHDRTQPQCNNKPDENVFEIYKDDCAKCGAKRVDSQIGLEKTPEEYVEKLTAVFREVRRVLKKEGTLWLNLGDSYSTQHETGTTDKAKGWTSATGIGGRQLEHARAGSGGLPSKNLVGIPWRVAFALQADGWYLRQDIIWAKPNPMPESVTDRCTKSHEYIFLMSKSPRYYFDNEAIKENTVTDENRPDGIVRDRIYGYDSKQKKLRDWSKSGGNLIGKGIHKRGNEFVDNGEGRSILEPRYGRNKRSVWTITTKPYAEAHFATFPEDLVHPMILAGCPVGGVVLDCFAGSGTTLRVAELLRRNWVGIELNPDYIKLAQKRNMQKVLL